MIKTNEKLQKYVKIVCSNLALEVITVISVMHIQDIS